MLLRKQIESFQDVSYNFQLLDRLIRGQGLDGDHIREVPAIKITGSLQAGQVVIGSDTKFEEGYDPNTVSLETRTYILESLGNLGNMAWEDAVELSMLGATVIQGGYIVTGMIDASRIDTGTLNADRIAARTISASKIIIGSITIDEMAAGSIGSNQIQGGAIMASHILSGAITTAKLEAGAVTADKISVSTLSSISADIGTITAGSISANLITSGVMMATRIYGGTLTGVTLDVEGDHNLGNKLILSKTSAGAGIQWGASPGSAASMYYVPEDNRLVMLCTGGVYAGSTRIDIPPSSEARFG